MASDVLLFLELGLGDRLPVLPLFGDVLQDLEQNLLDVVADVNGDLRRCQAVLLDFAHKTSELCKNVVEVDNELPQVRL